MIEYAQGGLIPDEPTDESMARVLELMTRRLCKEVWASETPRRADMMPIFDVTIRDYICFLGDRALEDESTIMQPDHVARMLRGERIRYRYTASGQEYRTHYQCLWNGV